MEMARVKINTEGWQDYRGNHAGVMLYVETSSQSILPIRDQLNENGKGNLFEPNYETSTYGMKSCFNTKQINSIVKNKYRYVLFGTKYNGLSAEHKGKFIIFGYMRIDKIKDLRSKHIHDYMRNPDSKEEPDCIRFDKAWACYSEDTVFLDIENCVELSKDQLKEWGIKARLTKQMKLVLEDETLDALLNTMSGCEDKTEAYIETTAEFIHAMDEEDDGEDDDVEDEDDDF